MINAKWPTPHRASQPMPNPKCKQLRRIAVMVAIILALGFSTTALAKLDGSLIEVWSLRSTFAMPESAAYDQANQQVFVSNVNEYAKDGNGFISRISHDGAEVELKWLSGLDSPTGLAVRGNILYVVDYDRLLFVDIRTATVTRALNAPDATPALNDVAISTSGEVFVSGSLSNTIYHVQNDRLVVWKHDDAQLALANGLLVVAEQVIFGGKEMHVFDLNDQHRIETFAYPKSRLADIDGITTDGCGGYLMTLINDARIWHLNTFGDARPLTNQAINGIDLDFVAGRLYVPSVGGGLTVFEVSIACGSQSTGVQPPALH